MDKVTKKLNAVIYIRVSTERQAKKGTSLETQVERCTAYAKKKEFRIVRTFKEEGESAKVADRPELLKMLSYLQSNKDSVDALIVYKLDRLSRNTDDQHKIMYKLSQVQVELHSATENIDASATGKFMRTVLWGVAELDNAIRSERVRDGMYARFKEGYWPFACPSGYVRYTNPENEKPELRIHPEYGPMITWAAEQRINGRDYAWIAAQLKKRGFKTSYGKYPTKQSVHRILQNPTYYGLSRAFGEDVMGKHEPLIPYETFLQMRVIDGDFGHLQKRRNKQHPDFPLVHTVKCTGCGMEIKGSYSRGHLGVRYPYYHHYNKYCPLARTRKRTTMHDSFVAYLNKLKPTPKHLELFRAVALDVAKKKSEQQAEEQRRFDKQIAGLQKKREQLIELMLNDPDFQMISKAECLERKQNIETEIEAVRIERNKCEVSEVSIQKYLDRCIKVITDPGQRWLTYKLQESIQTFQKELFPAGIVFDGERCRTHEMSPIVEILDDFPTTKSGLVRPPGLEPGTVGLKGHCSTIEL
jgi:site-specific DNA recombinase